MSYNDKYFHTFWTKEIWQISKCYQSDQSWKQTEKEDYKRKHSWYDYCILLLFILLFISPDSFLNKDRCPKMSAMLICFKTQFGFFFLNLNIFSRSAYERKKNQKWSIAWWVVFIRKSERHMKGKEVKEKCFIRKLKISKNVPIFSIFFFVGRLFVLLICKSAYIFLTHGCFLFASTEVEQILFS